MRLRPRFCSLGSLSGGPAAHVDRRGWRSVAKSGRAGKAKAPLRARLCAIFGCVLMVVSGGVLVTSQVLIARYSGAVKTQNLFGDEAAAATVTVSDIKKGPLSILLV